MSSPTKRRRVLAALTACALAATTAAACLLAAPTTARADDREVMAYSLDGSGNRVNYYTTDEAISAGYEGKVIYLDCDWMFTGTMKVADSKSLTIDMNGHKITSQGNGSVIRMEEHAKLTLRSGSATRTFDYTGYDENKDLAERTITTGGLIVGGSNTSDGDAIHMEKGGTLTLDNTAIAGNTNSEGSGAVYTKGDCTVNINNGATIKNNYSRTGGIVFDGEDCHLNMDNGSIENNLGGDTAGGVYGNADGLRITMENGSHISNNTGYNGGGIRFAGSWYYVVSNDKTGRIENNKAVNPGGCQVETYGGGISVGPKNAGYSCEGRIQGLAISGNHSRTSGGGISVNQENTRVIDCAITNNSCDGYGGGILYNVGDRGNTLEGCTVTGNTSVKVGGGVYVSKNLKLAGVCTVKDNKSGQDAASADDLYVQVKANIYGEAEAGSQVGLCCADAEKRLLGYDLNYVDGTYFSDFDGYYIYKGAGGKEAWMFPTCASPKFTVTVERPVAGAELPQTARFTWSNEDWEFFDYRVQWVDENGCTVSGAAQEGKSYCAQLVVAPHDGCGFTLPGALSAGDVTVRYANDASTGSLAPQDAHIDADGALSVSTAPIAALAS